MKKKKLIGGPLIEVWYDGACEPVNPGGHGGGGWLVKERGKIISKGKHYIPAAPNVSNNVAEYTGAISAMEWLIENNLTCRTIIVHGDNMMSVMQMAGKWKCRGGFYAPLYRKAIELVKFFPRISFKWIPREKNNEADEISKLALKERGVNFRIQPE